MQEKKIELVDQIMTALQKVIDPELLVDVVNLGLIYGIEIEGEKAIIKMTLTISGCPLSSYLQNQIQKAVLSVKSIKECEVKLVWYPVWTPDRMTVAAKRQLGLIENQQALDQEREIESTEKKEKIIDFSVPIKKLAEEYPDFIEIMYQAGFTRIKIPGLLSTVGRVMTIPLGAQAMKLDLNKIKKEFEAHGYKIVEG